jgi:hypothetical protein
MHRVSNLQTRKHRGFVLLPAFAIMLLVLAAGMVYVTSSVQRTQNIHRQMFDAQGTQLCEAGTQALLLNLWVPFKSDQSFSELDATCTGASAEAPVLATSGTVDGKMMYASAVIGYSDPNNDSYSRQLVIRSVGWIDQNGNGVPDANEPQKVVDVTVTFALTRSEVFDYAYFVNNFGWMDGFGQNDLVVNGDMRSNGNFSFTNGSPTVNGSVYASMNNELTPASQGVVNMPPVKWSNSQYAANEANTNANNQNRWRPAYNQTVNGAPGSTQFSATYQNVFISDGSVVNNSIAGSVIGDVTGTRAWDSSSAGSYTTTTLSSTPSTQVVMPDLSNLGSVTDPPNANGSYIAQSKAYIDQLATYSDGTANPNYGQGAYAEVWNSDLNNGQGAYQTVSTNGVVNGSVGLVGSAAHPVLIHGPVSITGDAVITGNISGQGTIYTGRNVHIVGSIIYNNPPNFNNGDPLGAANQKADMVALAACGSIIMGDTSQYGYYPLAFMMPPFTNGRYDDQGNWIPPYNAQDIDTWGIMKYESLLGDAYIHSVSSGINQIDAVMYTNFVGGGNIGTGGQGCVINGSIISKDEAMVTWSLPMQMNYDMRIRERSLNQTPMIDLQLPRSPELITIAWQDLGFSYTGP